MCTVCVCLELPDGSFPTACALPGLTDAWKFWRKFFRAPGKSFGDKSKTYPVFLEAWLTSSLYVTLDQRECAEFIWILSGEHRGLLL